MDFPDFTLFIEENTSSAAMVKKHLGAELFHDENGAPYVRGTPVSLSDTAGLTFLAVAKKDVRIGVDAELALRIPPKGFSSLSEWTDLEAYCKASGKNLFALAKKPPDISSFPGVKAVRINARGCIVSVVTIGG